MSAHRRHLITRKSDGFFWCGMFGFKPDPRDALRFDSLKSAYVYLREICSDDSLSVRYDEKKFCCGCRRGPRCYFARCSGIAGSTSSA